MDELGAILGIILFTLTVAWGLFSVFEKTFLFIADRLSPPPVKSAEPSEAALKIMAQNVPDKEKTKALMALFKINVDFSKKSHSYIVESNFFVLSNKLNFVHINHQLMSMSGHRYFFIFCYFLPYTLLYELGIRSIFTLNADRQDIADVRQAYACFEQLADELHFAPSHLLINRYLKNRVYTRKSGQFVYHRDHRLNKVSFGRPILKTDGKLYFPITTYQPDFKNGGRLLPLYEYHYNLTNHHLQKT